MSSWKSGFVEVDGLRLHYTRTGSDGTRPPVVLAHGYTDDGLCWTPVAQVLEADYDLIMVDARSHGRSESVTAAYGIQDLASDLRGVILGLGLQRPALLGHSMGGRTTLALAGLYPDVPGAILLEDADALGIAAASQAVDEERRARIRTDLEALQLQTRADLLASIRQQQTWSEAEYATWADAKLRLNPHGLDLLNTGIDWPLVLPRITCPALLMIADPDRGAMISEQRAAEMRSLIPHLQVAHIAGAGHSIHREQPSRFIEVVRAFLAGWAATRG